VAQPLGKGFEYALAACNSELLAAVHKWIQRFLDIQQIAPLCNIWQAAAVNVAAAIGLSSNSKEGAAMRNLKH